MLISKENIQGGLLVVSGVRGIEIGSWDESGRTRAKREVVKFALKLSVILKALETWYRYSLRVRSFWLGFVPSYSKRKRILWGESFSQKNKNLARQRQQIYAKVLEGFTKDECGIRNWFVRGRGWGGPHSQYGRNFKLCSVISTE
jgi:hypothetical protein